MEINLNLLNYLLQDKYEIEENIRKDRAIHHFRQFRGSKITHEDTLYVLTEKDAAGLKEIEGLKGAFIIVSDIGDGTSFRQVPAGMSVSVKEQQAAAGTDNRPVTENTGCREAVMEMAEGNEEQKELNAETAAYGTAEIFRLHTADSDEEVFDYILNLVDDIREWERNMSMALFERSGIETVANLGRRYLRHEIAIIDQNLNFVYQSPNFQKAVDRIIGEDAGTIEGELIVEKQFHEVAGRKEAFYYYSPNLGFSDLCKNVFINDKYFARVLLQMDRSETEIPRGEYELFDLIGSYITGALENLIYSDSHHFTDSFHDTCRKLIGGIDMDTDSIISILNMFDWQQEDRYSVLKISFYDNNNWDVHQKLAVAYIAKSLERKWTHTCALPFEDYIYWIINETREKVQMSSRAFNQEIKLFLRENVCNAGVSSSFEGFLMFGAAGAQAEYALKLGRRFHPEQWYYMFENYRTECIMDMMSGKRNSETIMHPALYILKKYDLRHDSELCDTLKIYLESNFNMTKAAEKASIHRTSFCRRMDQIIKLTGLDLEDKDTVFQLMVSYRL